MDRDVFAKLESWKDSPFRKPLVLKGARQVGKTWALREFGRTSFSNCAYFSLEEAAPGVPSEFAALFEATRDPRRIASNLSFASGQPIVPGETLLVLDEIQDCPAAIGALKYFCEEYPELHVACAGSLLGVSLARSGSAFPVGKVEFAEVHPLSFSEFLRAVNLRHLDEYLNGICSFEPIPRVFADQLTEQLQRYFAVGGMPEAVLRWAETESIQQVDKVLADLLDSYERDFAKHGGSAQFAKVSLVWRSLPAQLARENKKFAYGVVKEGARARGFEEAIQWLVGAGLVKRVFRNAKPGVPLAAYDDQSAFKAYCLDVGVLRRLARLDAAAFGHSAALFEEFKGAFAENYVLQAIAPQLDDAPRYWVNDKPRHEVDFLMQVGNGVVPVEVKAGESVRSASLKYFGGKHPDAAVVKLRLSLRNLSLDGDVLNVPLYLAHRAVSLVSAALEAGARRS